MFYDSATGTVRQQTTEYTLHGKNIVHWSSGTNAMHFFYDAQNRPAVVVHNGKPYGYLYNLQGDVIALIDSSGNRVVEYRYDAWGRILSKTGTMASTLGTLNPFRYRGYVYDGETGLYYLRSRYYQPNWARFLNADALLNKRHLPLSSNLFAYCKSNSTNKVDTDGYGDIYVFYYHWDGSKSSLENQAQNAPYYNWEEVKGIEVASSADFINAWNAMDDTDVDDVYIFLHRSPGILNMDHDIISSDGEYSFDQLEYKKVQNAVFLFSCYGAAVDANNNSVALQLMKHTSAPKLYACEVGVSFSKIIDRGSARVTWKHYFDGVPYWAKFIRRGNMIIKQMLDTLILRKE